MNILGLIASVMQEVFAQPDGRPTMGQQSYQKFAEVSKLVASLQKHLSQSLPQKQGGSFQRPGSASFAAGSQQL